MDTAVDLAESYGECEFSQFVIHASGSDTFKGTAGHPFPYMMSDLQKTSRLRLSNWRSCLDKAYRDKTY